MRILIFIAFVVFCLPSAALSQEADSARYYIDRLDSGHVAEVLEALPRLTEVSGDTASLTYLRARTESRGIEALKLYQSIVDKFPRSEWADDALYRIHQYYVSMGLHRTASAKLDLLGELYPDSPYLTVAAQGVEKHEPAPPSESTAESRTEPATGAANKGKFTIQTGAFSTMKNAEKQKRFFEERGYTVEIFSRIGDSRTLYLVWVGKFVDEESAKRKSVEFNKKFGVASMVVGR